MRITNWKTTLSGIVAIAGVVVKLINNPTSMDASDVAAVTAGVGLLLAKDKDVTGVGVWAERPR